jgi:hypothetical protein
VAAKRPGEICSVPTRLESAHRASAWNGSRGSWGWGIIFMIFVVKIHMIPSCERIINDDNHPAKTSHHPAFVEDFGLISTQGCSFQMCSVLKYEDSCFCEIHHGEQEAG